MALNYKIFLILLFLLFLCFVKVNAYETQEPDTKAQMQSTEIDSLALLKSKLQLYPDNVDLRLILAEYLLKLKQLDEAEKEFEKVLENNSQNIQALTGMGKMHFFSQPSGIIPYERLKELLKKDHKSKAIKEFDKAMAIDPQYLPARYFRARTYLEKDGRDDLSIARDEFKNLYQENPFYRDVIYQLGYAFQKLADFENALRILKKIEKSDVNYAKAQIRLSEIYFELKLNEDATKCYFSGIESLEDQEMWDYLFEDIKILLSPEELIEFDNVQIQTRKILFKKFWKSRDPDPSNVVNERLVEHLRRVKYAHENFHFTAPPYYDDRGKIYIKYGEPDAKYSSASGSIPSKDNESWSYENIHKGMVFDFVSEGGYFKLARDLTEAGLAGENYYSRLALASSLYSERSHLGPAYANLSVNFSQDNLNDFNAEKDAAVHKFPGEIYQIEKKIKPLPFLTKYAQFRGADNKTRFECYTSFPGFALTFNKTGTNFLNYTDFYIEFLDSIYNSIKKEHNRFSILVQSLEHIEQRQFVFQRNFQLEPGKFNISLVAHNADQTMKSVQNKVIQILDFSSDSLMLSDLQLSSEISEIDVRSSENFIKNNLKITPYTFSQIMKRNPIYLYFEIYNLGLDGKDQTNYEISYTLKTIQADRNLWQKTFGSISRIFSRNDKNIITTSSSRFGDSSTAFEYIAFDLSNLENGVTELAVKITDQVKRKAIEKTIEFTLIK